MNPSRKLCEKIMKILKRNLFPNISHYERASQSMRAIKEKYGRLTDSSAKGMVFPSLIQISFPITKMRAPPE